MFATEAAVAMCGDERQGLELALRPPVEPGAPASEWLAALDDMPAMTAAEEAEYTRRERERDLRVENSAIMRIAWPYTRLAHDWLKERCQTLRQGADPVLADALDVIVNDASLITVKLSRAVDGADRYRHDETAEDDPVQNDWNGSAKVASILMERSETAWRTVAAAAGGEVPITLADQLRGLRALVDTEFPHARDFTRPGFDGLHGP